MKTKLKLFKTTNYRMASLKGKTFVNHGTKNRPLFIEVDGDNYFATSPVQSWRKSPDGDKIMLFTKNSLYVFKVEDDGEQRQGFLRKAMSADLA